MRSTEGGAPGQIIDISQTISSDIAVWPGDTKFSLDWVMRLDQGCSCNVSTLRLSAHTGTHADAPFHFVPGGAKPAEVDLSRYVGRCRVLTIASADAVRPCDVEGIDWSRTERLLMKTPRSTRETDWRDDFTHLSVEAAQLFRDRGLKLVGLDTPSIDHMQSKTLDAHKILSAAGIAILENLALAHVEDGEYELIALPLKIRDGDASPVRAILRTLA
jgi:arylformamidase